MKSPLSDQLLGEILAWATDSRSEERQAPTKRHVRRMIEEIRARRRSLETAGDSIIAEGRW